MPSIRGVALSARSLLFLTPATAYTPPKVTGRLSRAQPGEGLRPSLFLGPHFTAALKFDWRGYRYFLGRPERILQPPATDAAKPNHSTQELHASETSPLYQSTVLHLHDAVGEAIGEMRLVQRA